MQNNIIHLSKLKSKHINIRAFRHRLPGSAIPGKHSREADGNSGSCAGMVRGLRPLSSGNGPANPPAPPGYPVYRDTGTILSGGVRETAGGRGIPSMGAVGLTATGRTSSGPTAPRDAIPI